MGLAVTAMSRLLFFSRDVFLELRRCAWPSPRSSLWTLGAVVVGFPMLGVFALVVRMLTTLVRDLVLAL
jgi:preprotein translocase subunit SecE